MTWIELIANCWLDDQAYSPADTDQFIYDLKRTVFEDDVLLLLTKFSSHYDSLSTDQMNSDFLNGYAQKLSLSLHKCLLCHPSELLANEKQQKQFYSTRLEPKRGLQVAVLCIAIDRLLQCSNEMLKIFWNKFEWNLTESLPYVVKTFLKSNIDPVTRFVTLSRAVRMMKRMTEMAPRTIINVVESLLNIIEHSIPKIPYDILVEAACTMSHVATEEVLKNECISKRVGDNSSSIISILDTVLATASVTDQVHYILVGFGNLSFLPTIAKKLMKSRNTVLSVTNRLQSDNREIRRIALNVIRAMVQSFSDLAETFSIPRVNLELIKSALVDAILNEEEIALKMLILLTFHDLLSSKCLNSKETSDVMEILYSLSENDSSDKIIIESAMLYLHAAGKQANSHDVLANVVNFTTNFSAKIRAKSLWLLKDVSYGNPETSKIIVDRTDALEKFSLIISHGSDKDCLEVLQICKQLIFEGNCFENFCKHQNFIEALVRLVTKDPIENRRAYTVGADIILRLMSKGTCVPYFLPFTGVLPWLVKIANRTSDDKLKDEVIDAVIRFSSAILRKAYEV